jgi:quercetin dioxygenase-like cupin family protein
MPASMPPAQLLATRSTTKEDRSEQDRPAPTSDFTIKNLQEVESSAADGSGLQARVTPTYLDSEHLGVSYFRYEPGVRTPFGHSHGEQEEAYVVVGGSGRARLDEEVVELRQWDVLRIAPHVVPALEGGPAGLELIAIGSDRTEGEGEQTVKGFWTD